MKTLTFIIKQCLAVRDQNQHPSSANTTHWEDEFVTFYVQ